MKELNKMRLGVLRELKHIIRFFQDMEKSVKSRDEARIYPAYVYVSTLAYHMQEGDLTPFEIELKQAILHKDYLNELEEK